jgi:hypothetical protein
MCRRKCTLQNHLQKVKVWSTGVAASSGQRYYSATLIRYEAQDRRSTLAEAGPVEQYIDDASLLLIVSTALQALLHAQHPSGNRCAHEICSGCIVALFP